MELKFTCNTFEEAMDIHKKMFQKLREQGYVTHRDFTEICGVCKEEFMDSKYRFYGWYNLQNLKVEQDSNGVWCIVTPELVELV